MDDYNIKKARISGGASQIRPAPGRNKRSIYHYVKSYFSNI